MDGDSGEFSDELDVFEESDDNRQKQKGKNHTTYKDKPYDEGIEFSQDLSMAESFDPREKNNAPKERESKFANQHYDEAYEVSQSQDMGPSAMAAGKAAANSKKPAVEEKGAKGMKKDNEQSKSQTVLNNKFDEALEFSRSGSDESVDTRASQKNKKNEQPEFKSSMSNKGLVSDSQSSKKGGAPQQQQQPSQQQQQQQQQHQQRQSHTKGDDESSSGGEEEGEHEESYDNIEGAYNPRDYQHLNVTAEVRDLFQYIERYKPQEVELDTPLKCFIPEYIPAIGELDAFVKIPRPDHKEDGLGLRFLDEPSPNQSDPTVLELQLRAGGRSRYGDVVVRAIEHADKNPNRIEKWIKDIGELHRSKPPVQVNYKKAMPEIDKLMDVWPEEFEQLLQTVALPSPNLDMSLGEYVKVLCTILDIPVYDNPVESLHLMFTLFMEFRNNPHFQAMANDAVADEKGGRDRNSNNNYGNADVLDMNDDPDYK